MSKFKELLQASIKSRDTEEWIDLHFTRPVGLVFALLFKRLGVHPNAVTALSIVLGIAAARCFYFTDTAHNAAGVLLLVLANLCDSTDGQLARLTDRRSFVGRVLDGFSGQVWFFCIYLAIALRLQSQSMPFTNTRWGLLIWALAVVAGIFCHAQQSSLSDYYRQIHLYFVNGESGSELDSYQQQHTIYRSLAKGEWLKRLFYANYAAYCKNQERRTPAFQRFFAQYGRQLAPQLRRRFIEGSRPLMVYTNILTFNVRALCLYLTCMLGCPWVYLLFEIIFLQALYIYMHKQHEMLCRSLTPTAIP